jgi:aerobic-type carbon monoxide dehydrogenase small subunit (CoxS/CutS family)
MEDTLNADTNDQVTLQINGCAQSAPATLTKTLLTTLREDLRLTATKRGCNQGVCGACTVLIDGRTARACLTLSHNATETQVQTLEGLRDDPLMKTLQGQFASQGALQCGFCTPGMLMSAYALLSKNRLPSEADVRAAMSGNLCRCSGYQSIVSAVTCAGQAYSQGEKQA